MMNQLWWIFNEDNDDQKTAVEERDDNVQNKLGPKLIGFGPFILKVKKFAESAFQSQKNCEKSA